MLRILLILSAMLVGTAGAAAAAPLFAVTGVAPGDRLNVRTRPDARAPVVARLAPDASGIAVGTRQGAWVQVTVAGRSGWVAARFLRPQPEPLSPSLTCSGTEPFWSLALSHQGLRWTTPEGARALTMRSDLTTGGTRALIGGDAQGRLTAVIESAQCSDGMSDATYPMRAAVILDGSGGPSRLLTGCCRAAAQSSSRSTPASPER